MLIDMKRNTLRTILPWIEELFFSMPVAENDA
jgi:hypothetical protein